METIQTTSEAIKEDIDIEVDITEQVNNAVESINYFTEEAVTYLKMLVDLNRLSPAEEAVFYKEIDPSIEMEEYSDITIKKAYASLVKKGLLQKPSLGVYAPSFQFWHDKIRFSNCISFRIEGGKVFIDVK